MEGVFEEAVISPDGEKVTITVHGVKGSGCTEMQKKYLALGAQGDGHLTEEYYEAPMVVQTDVFSDAG